MKILLLAPFCRTISTEHPKPPQDSQASQPAEPEPENTKSPSTASLQMLLIV